MKKFFSVVLAVMMVVSTMSFTTSAAVTKFEDVNSDNEYLAEAIDFLEHLGVVKGISDTEFGPEELVTRQQFALFMYRLMKGGKDAPATGANSTKFTDLVDPTYNFAISWAYQSNIVNGRSATEFDPKGAITLQDAYTMIVRALDYETDDEKLSYPIGYIDVAEKEEVNLPEGLASEVDYGDALTRGDMAILLYNAFFAEIGIAEIRYQSANGYIVPEEYYPILCEKAFGVQKAIYQVVATPHYKMADADDIESTSSIGYDALVMKSVKDDNIERGPSLAYITPEELGIKAEELDDQFLAHYTIFYTLKQKGGNKVFDKILYADTNYVKKTVNKITFSEGKATADGETFYFYDAPASYVKQNYPPNSSEEEKKAFRNSKNIKVIDFSGKTEITASVTAINNETELTAKFKVAKNNGFFTADIYDVDGDSYYDYINYQPYWFFQISKDEDYTIADTDDTAVIPVVYANEATLSGQTYEDEDFVIGYFDKVAKKIYIDKVVKPVAATISRIDKTNSIITLNNGSSIAVSTASKYVENNISKVSGLLSAGVLNSDEANYYIVNDVLYYTDSSSSNDPLVFTDNIIIPTTFTDEDGLKTTSQLDVKTGKETTYLYAWVGGERRFVPVDTDSTSLGLLNIDELCTYSVSASGLYTIESLSKTIVGSDEEDLDSKDKSIQVYIDSLDDVTLKKKIGTIFSIQNEDKEYVVSFQDYTKIIIKNTNTVTDKVEYFEFDNSSFKSTSDVKLNNVAFVLTNNINSTSREYLAFFYAEATDFGFASSSVSSNERIVSSSTFGLDENGYARNYYSLLNPFTGEKESNVPGNISVSNASALEPALTAGSVVNLKDDMVDEKSGSKADANSQAKQVWIMSYFESEGILEVVSMDGLTEWQDATEQPTMLYQIDDSSVVTLTSAFTGTLKVVEDSVLGSDNNTYKAYNTVSGNKRYATYQKAYIKTSAKSDDDLPIVDYIIIIANSGENVKFLKSHK